MFSSGTGSRMAPVRRTDVSWKPYLPPKRRFFLLGLHGAKYQRTTSFIFTCRQNYPRRQRFRSYKPVEMLAREVWRYFFVFHLLSFLRTEGSHYISMCLTYLMLLYKILLSKVIVAQPGKKSSTSYRTRKLIPL